MNVVWRNIVIVLCLAVLGFAYYLTTVPTDEGSPNPDADVQKVSSLPENAMYMIEGEPYRLFEGVFNGTEKLGATTTTRLELVGEPVLGDLDGDGDDDAVVVLRHEPGGSGSFYYVAGAVYDEGKYLGGIGEFIGDRIVVDDLAISEEVGEVRYRTHAQGTPLASMPTEATVYRFRFDTTSLELETASLGN